MKLEMVPVILGVLVCLLGIGICFVAFQPEALRPVRERRRRIRAEPHQMGQLLLGIGTICMGAALMGRDTWRYSTLVVFAGIALIVTGGIMNREFLKELIMFRGAARRGDGKEQK
jgi:hypothetical protein